MTESAGNLLEGMMIYTVIKQFLLPPGLLMAGMLAGLAAPARWRRPGRALALACLAALWLLSTNAVANRLLSALEGPPASVPDPSAQAIVVLAADLDNSAPEYGGATVGPLTLERIRYGARLRRLTGLPLLVTGGPGVGAGAPLATLMARALAEDFGVTATWVEPRSRTTAENAAFSAPLLAAAGIRTVYLVTHAWHMPRARAAFEHSGLTVVAAPTGFVRGQPQWLSLLPGPLALQRSYWALHELAGRLWYHLAYGMD